TINSTVYSQTANNASYLGTVVASSYANTTNTSATNITAGTLPWAQAPSGTVNTAGNFTLAGNITFNANAIFGNTISANGSIGTAGQVLTSPGAGANAYWTSNVTVNNANYLGTVVASSYANTTNTSATNITAGTLPWGQAPSGTVNTAGNFTLAGNITYSANVILQSTLSANGGVGTSGQLLTSNGTTGAPYWSTVSSGAVGTTTQIAYNKAGTESGDANLLWYTANGTLVVANGIIVGLTTNTSINTTAYSGTANNASYLGGTIASSYASTSNTSATNITTGTLPWGQAPSGTVNTVGNFTLAGNTTFSANTIITKTVAVNGSVGILGQALISGGSSTNAYWGTAAASGPIGSTTQIAFNNAGTESGDANLLWYTANGTVVIANGFILGAAANEVTVNTTTIQIGNATIFSTVNSTIFSQTANNASYLGGTIASTYASTSNTSATNITA